MWTPFDPSKFQDTYEDAVRSRSQHSSFPRAVHDKGTPITQPVREVNATCYDAGLPERLGAPSILNLGLGLMFPPNRLHALPRPFRGDLCCACPVVRPMLPVPILPETVGGLRALGLVHESSEK